MTPEKDCDRFNVCGASLCPLDSGLSERIWYADEAVCKSQKHGRHRWIRKQRSIQRRQTTSWIDRPVTFSQLFDASRKKSVSPATLKRLKSMREQNQTQWRKVSAPNQPGEYKPMHP